MRPSSKPKVGRTSSDDKPPLHLQLMGLMETFDARPEKSKCFLNCKSLRSAASLAFRMVGGDDSCGLHHGHPGCLVACHKGDEEGHANHSQCFMQICLGPCPRNSIVMALELECDGQANASFVGLTPAWNCAESSKEVVFVASRSAHSTVFTRNL